MKRFVKNLFVLFMWYPLRLAVRILPLGATYGLGVLGGAILRALSGEKSRLMAEELGRAFPGLDRASIDGMVRGSFVNYCLSEIEVLLYPVLNRAYVERHVTVEGREHLDRALAQGRGVLLFQAHFGAFQMTMPVIGYLGYAMNQISASASAWKGEGALKAQQRTFDIKARYEYLLPVKHIGVQSSMRPVFRALEAGEIVGITVDGGGGKRVSPIRFLGREALFQTGAADLAIGTGATIVPAFILTEPGLRHRLVLHGPIGYDAALGKEENRAAILQAFAGLLEGYARRRADHYGYTLCLRRMRAGLDPYPFFTDYGPECGERKTMKVEGERYA